MNARRFAALLAVGAVTTVTCALGVTYIVERKAWRKHRAYREGRRGGAR